FNFPNSTSLTVGSVDGVNGITTTNGNINVQTNNGTLTVGDNIAAGTGNISLTATGGGTIANQAAISATNSTITLQADDQDLQAGSAITATNGEVNLRADAAGVPLDLGSTAAGFGFSQAELNTITAGDLRFTATGNATVSQDITLAAAKVHTLIL